MSSMSKDLQNFLLDEIEGHVKQLHELCLQQDPNLDTAEYHETRITGLIQKVKQSLEG